MSKLAERVLFYVILFAALWVTNYAVGSEHPINQALNWVLGGALAEYQTRRELAKRVTVI